ncbi:MAG: glycosyltransferase [bacterium]|nr:glycosyltransferase [bacterium]
MKLVESPRFTVVIPAYNREGTVARAIESALEQTFAPERIIVIDDGSTDGTRAVALSFGAPVEVITQTNAGVPTARNRGVRASETEWVALLDSDDYWYPEHLQRIAAAIEATDGAATFYFADIRRPANEGGATQWERAKFTIDGPHELLLDATPWVVRPRIPMMLQASVFHRDRFLASGGLWEVLHMRDDTHVFLNLGISGAACAVAGIGTEMTADDNSGNRLTTALGSKTLRYWVLSALMWRDLMERHPELSADAHRVLRRRLAVSHIRAARLALRSGSPLTGLGHALGALRADTPSLVRSGAQRLGLVRPDPDFRLTG